MKDFYTKEQIKLAKKVNLITLLKSRGEELVKSGSEQVWLKGSDKVNVRGNLWYHHNEKVGGDTLDFVMKFYNIVPRHREWLCRRKHPDPVPDIGLP